MSTEDQILPLPRDTDYLEPGETEQTYAQVEHQMILNKLGFVQAAVQQFSTCDDARLKNLANAAGELEAVCRFILTLDDRRGQHINNAGDVITNALRRLSDLEHAREADERIVDNMRLMLNNVVRQQDDKIDDLTQKVDEVATNHTNLANWVSSSDEHIHKLAREIEETREHSAKNWDNISATVDALRSERVEDMGALRKELRAFGDRLNTLGSQTADRFANLFDRVDALERPFGAEEEGDEVLDVALSLLELPLRKGIATIRFIAAQSGRSVDDVIAILEAMEES